MKSDDGESKTLIEAGILAFRVATIAQDSHRMWDYCIVTSSMEQRKHRILRFEPAMHLLKTCKNQRNSRDNFVENKNNYKGFRDEKERRNGRRKVAGRKIRFRPRGHQIASPVLASIFF